MFTTILIANRGEIACRIIKTARALGIKTIAIYSTADEDSMHVQMADEAYWVGEAPAKDSYLNIDSIIKVAKESQAQAIHPGYGFLSENPKFAQACAKANIIFIGPTIAALEAMGSKQLAKQLLEKTSVPLTPGYHGKEQSENILLEQAKTIGFPVLLKAANGGGGKGMRAVLNASDFSQALAGAKREAMASFADDTMIIEKLIQNPRHIEVQVMADNFGTVVHLFERDCSIQRRHQKIIEEATAPDLSEKLRQQLTQAACEVARAIDYRGAGTIEFLVDKNEHFYFMEMNTRLQVEHPVTEMITGLDLVAWQLHIAAGEALPLSQEQILAQGHAFECRIYAEDPANGFIPSIGTINFLKAPVGEGIRIDTGVTVSSQISQYYDPMIAKLITWGSDRDQALQRMQLALANYYIGGVKTNIPFLQAIFQHKKFMQAQLTTDFLDQETIQWNALDSDTALIMAIGHQYLQVITNISDPLLKDTFAWQQLGTNNWTWRYLLDGNLIQALIVPINHHQFNVDMHSQNPEACHRDTVQVHQQNDMLQITINHQHYKALVHQQEQNILIFSEQGTKQIQAFNWSQLDAETSAHKGQLTAPMPATVVAVLKSIGEEVKAGDRLIILEAMKMEHTIHAPTDGILKEIFYSVGAQVNEGAELLSLSEPGV